MRAYLELIRPANVITALGDVLAGYAVAGLLNRPVLPWLLLSTVCLYAGGVALNDVFDREIDRRERPERPIPSGRVAVGAAALLGGVLLAAGVLSALLASPTAGLVAGLTAASILLYDAWGKRQRIVGPFNMGLCRGLNFLLGMAAVPAVLGSVWFLAVIPLFYIAGVTALSRGEVHGGSRGPAAFALISLSLVSIALLVLTLNSRDPWPGTVLAAVLVLRVMPAFWAAYRSPAPATIRRAVRAGVLSLVLLNAAIGVTFASAQYGLVILATGAAAWALARIFAVT